jgi:hypothetical protein
VNEKGVFQLDFSCETTDLQKSTLFLDVGQAGDPVDVDQVSRTRQPELHHRNEALAAAQNLGVVTVPRWLQE